MHLKQDGEFKIRFMTLDDLEQVIDIEQASYSHPWTPGIFRDCLRVGYLCRVVEDNGRLVAYGILSHAAGEAHILNLCVDPARRRCGLGRMLLQQFINDAREFGAQTIFLEVRASNTAALELYQQLGFNEFGIRKDYYPHKKGREDAVVCALELK